jgi:hypothetical protein
VNPLLDGLTAKPLIFHGRLLWPFGRVASGDSCFFIFFSAEDCVFEIAKICIP